MIKILLSMWGDMGSVESTSEASTDYCPQHISKNYSTSFSSDKDKNCDFLCGFSTEANSMDAVTVHKKSSLILDNYSTSWILDR
uniref:Uncharacterized protein n=1 Tax=Romanomermis culicivorax TaxID=13658 RepID=A0A915JQM3_ROMCU